MGAAARSMARANGPALYFRSLSLWPPSRRPTMVCTGYVRVALRPSTACVLGHLACGSAQQSADSFLVTLAAAFNYFGGGVIRPFGPRPRHSGCPQRGPPPRCGWPRGAPAPSRLPRLQAIRPAAAPARWPGQGRAVGPRPAWGPRDNPVPPSGPGAWLFFRLTRALSGRAPASTCDFQNVLTLWGDPKRTTPPHNVEERFKNRIYLRCGYRQIFLWPAATPTHHPKRKMEANAPILLYFLLHHHLYSLS